MEHWEPIGRRVRVCATGATIEYGRFKSNHEMYAVLLEEVDELWSEVKKRHPNREALLSELIDIAAVAYRAAVQMSQELEAGD